MEKSQIQQGAGKHHQALRQFFLSIRFSLHIHTIFASLRHIISKKCLYCSFIYRMVVKRQMRKTLRIKQKLCDLIFSV